MNREFAIIRDGTLIYIAACIRSICNAVQPRESCQIQIQIQQLFPLRPLQSDRWRITEVMSACVCPSVKRVTKQKKDLPRFLYHPYERSFSLLL